MLVYQNSNRGGSTVRRLTVLLFLALPAFAQTTTRRPVVRAIGDATVSSTPDQATIVLAVETRSATAQDAAAQNAVLSSAVLAALQALLGANADIKTTNYSLSPLYNYPPNAQPVLTGYMVVNSIQTTLTSIGMTGKVLDTATQAGANQIQSLTFSLRDPEPFLAQALRQAALKARAHADAMVSGVGLHLGNVVLMQESGASPIVASTAPIGAALTPIQPGTVDIHATVILELEIVP